MDVRRTLSTLAFVAAIGLLGWWGVVAIRAQDRGPELVPPREPGPLAVLARALAAESATVAVEAYGTLLPAREARLAADEAGRVVSVHSGWRPGGLVRAGDEVLALDPDLAELEVRTAQARLAEAAAVRAGAERRARAVSDQLPLFETGLRLSARELERLEGLASVESELRVDAARSARNAAEVELELARERLGVAAVEVEVATAREAQAEAALALARQRLERRVVRAPFDARFADRPPGLGTYLQPGAPVARLVDVATLHLALEVPAHEVPGLREGLAARVSVPARPGHALDGTVRAVSVQADPALRVLAVEVEVRNEIEAPGDGGDGGDDGAGAAPPPLAAGQFARAVILVERLSGVVVVSAEELRREGGVPVAHVVRATASPPVLERRELLLGRRVRREDGTSGLVVLAGLAPGEVLATAPLDRLRDGAPVVPVEASTPGDAAGARR